jgi:hypothetical protein
LTPAYPYTEISGLPDQADALWLQLRIEAMATSPATITWFLASDSSCNHPITEQKAQTIIAEGKSAATDAGVAATLGVVWRAEATAKAGSLFFAAKLDAGTARVTAIIRGAKAR